MSRPANPHRLSVGSNASPVPTRGTHARSHTHTLSLSSVNSANRIGRRKSSTFSPATRPAVIEAAVEHAVAEGSLSINKRSSASKAALASLNEPGQGSSLPHSLPYHVSLPDDPHSAVIDGPSLSAFHALDKSKAKMMRRASDGTHLTKKEKAAAGDLKCEHCGKAYKHGSCLTKHLWEHTPQWQYTSKLLISKHQQVQLLEAASVLVAMNQDGPAGADSEDSSSPAASGSSDMRDDDRSSIETTPPPPGDHAYRDASKRYSTTSSAYSRSYQSVFSESAPNSEHHMWSHHRHWSNSSVHRPTTGQTSIADGYADEDPQDLAAAVGLLSCSYGTPKTGPTTLHMDVPPVPPLPEKYQPQAQRDVRMLDDEQDEEADEYSHRLARSPQRHDDADEGVFGRMDA